MIVELADSFMKILTEGKFLPSVIVILVIDLIIVVYASNYVIRKILEWTKQQIMEKDGQLASKDAIIERHATLLTDIVHDYHSNMKEIKNDLTNLNEKFARYNSTLEIMSVKIDSFKILAAKQGER